MCSSLLPYRLHTILTAPFGAGGLEHALPTHDLQLHGFSLAASGPASTPSAALSARCRLALGKLTSLGIFIAKPSELTIGSPSKVRLFGNAISRLAAANDAPVTRARVEIAVFACGNDARQPASRPDGQPACRPSVCDVGFVW